MSISQAVAKILLELKAVSLSAKIPFKYSSGLLSPIYTDCRILISYPQQRKQIRDFYIEAINNTGVKFDVIGGTATAGIPHAAWVAEKLDLPMIYVRGKAKDHGRGNRIEGKLEKGQNVAIIEDLVSTGESSIKTVKVIKQSGGKADFVFSIMSYKMKEADESFQNSSLQLISLTDIDQLINLAIEMGYIKESDKSIILDWTSDPLSWGKKMGFE